MSSAFVLLIGMLLVQSAVPRVVTHPLTAAEVTSTASILDRSQIEDFAGKLQVQKQQAFAVQSSSSSFRFEPVIYEANDVSSGNTVPRCGVFVLREKAKSAFVPTLGSTWTYMETCTALDGVGFVETGVDMPRILLLYSASSPNYSTREPIVLDWDSASKQYRGNKDLSLALTHKGGNTSIAGMKRRIAELAVTHK